MLKHLFSEFVSCCRMVYSLKYLGDSISAFLAAAALRRLVFSNFGEKKVRRMGIYIYIFFLHIVV